MNKTEKKVGARNRNVGSFQLRSVIEVSDCLILVISAPFFAFGAAFGVRKLRSRVGESQILQIEGLRQPRVAQMGFRQLFRRSPELSGEGF